MQNFKRLKYKTVLDYESLLQESIQVGVSVLRLLYDRYIPVRAKGENTGIYDMPDKKTLIIKWNE